MGISFSGSVELFIRLLFHFITVLGSLQTFKTNLNAFLGEIKGVLVLYGCVLFSLAAFACLKLLKDN